jgi:hypothetical protein
LLSSPPWTIAAARLICSWPICFVSFCVMAS